MVATKSKETTFKQTSPTELEMTRIFDAPPDLVYQAYTDSKAIPQWWGPARLTTTVETNDVRPGGHWRFIQKDEDGNIFAFNGVYREVKRPERLVSTFEFEGMPGHILVNTATFEDLGGMTKIVAKTVFDNETDLQAMLQSGMESGAVEGWDRLALVLDTYGQ
jgi:uncharacterized protein YndB with AHSA1/START domain